MRALRVKLRLVHSRGAFTHSGVAEFGRERLAAGGRSCCRAQLQSPGVGDAVCLRVHGSRVNERAFPTAGVLVMVCDTGR